MNKSLDETFRKNLEAQIGKVEAETSVEFVPAWVESSSNYAAFRIGMAVAVAVVLDVFHRYVALKPVQQYSLYFVCLILLAFFLFADKRLVQLVPQKLKRARVEEAALKSFLTNEVFATRGRTGVLIFVSQVERAVFVLADKGLLKAFPASYWSGLGAKLAKDFDAEKPGHSFIEALDLMRPDLAKAFPPDADNANELPNNLRG